LATSVKGDVSFLIQEYFCSGKSDNDLSLHKFSSHRAWTFFLQSLRLPFNLRTSSEEIYFISLKNQFYFSGENEKYRLYRNKISTLTRISKKLYFHNFFSHNLNNTKKIWEGIKDLIGPKDKRKHGISSVRYPNNSRVTTNPEEISDVLNTHFATVGFKLASVMPQSKRDFREYLLGPSPSSSFFFDPITPQK